MDPTAPDAAVSHPQIREFFSQHIPFNHYLGLELDTLGDGVAQVRLPFKPQFVGDPLRPALHGGVIATLLDTAGGAALWTTLALADRISTVDIRVDYLRPGRLEALIAEARVRRAGNRMGVVSIKTWHPGTEDEIIAEAMAVYNIRREIDAR